ncbi:MAG: Fis family transcriptional regulator [Epsilonproteobacteria bacterium]|nr:Fis family transcriptional regulator [Campylobacterota bacterium]
MKTVQFLSNSIQVKNIIKGLTLSKSLFVSILIVGEPHTGKKSLVRTLYREQNFIDGGDFEKVNRALESSKEVIIYNFDKIESVDSLNFENKRVVAISNRVHNSSVIDRKFAFIYNMPPLRDRLEDVELLSREFIKEIREELMLDSSYPISISPNSLDLSMNIKSLRADIYKRLILNNISRKDIENILYDYLYENLGGNNAYRENLPIFERPLIEAGLKRYRSQLRLSSILGLNRNTLRKKINELGIN